MPCIGFFLRKRGGLPAFMRGKALNKSTAAHGMDYIHKCAAVIYYLYNNSGLYLLFPEPVGDVMGLCRAKGGNGRGKLLHIKAVPCKHTRQGLYHLLVHGV